MLQGKSALVTGSTSGIGLAIARAMAAQGANVTINGFGDKNTIEKERVTIEKDYKVKALYSPADMSKPSDIAEMVRASEKAFGSLDVLVNNAGIQFVSPIEGFRSRNGTRSSPSICPPPFTPSARRCRE